MNLKINNDNVNLVHEKDVPTCMERLSKDIQELVQSADTMGKDEYLKRAVQLQYRFIRIHPFRDSNGRTSRALLNMMTIPKGMIMEVQKEKKAGFVQSQRYTNEQLDSQGYFEALSGNLNELDRIESNNMELPTYEFIKQNCIIDIETFQVDNKSMQKQRENQEQQKE